MFKDNLTGVYVGVVEDNVDPKRRGRVKIRIEKLHGRATETDFIPVEDLPWASPELESRGLAFSVPDIGKVMHVTFLDGDRYCPVFTNAEHYNYNLQGKLQSLVDDSYTQFYAVVFDDKHQYYHDKDQGVVFDYVKSNLNIDPKGNMRLNLRDGKSKLFLGTENATQQAMLGNHWMEWFDKLVHNLIGGSGGPYLGNLGAPVLPNPAMIQLLNEYYALRESFLSEHVMVVDNQRVKAQTRGFDSTQRSDAFNDESQEILKTPEQRGYEPVESPIVEQEKEVEIVPESESVVDNSPDSVVEATPEAAPPVETKQERQPTDFTYKHFYAYDELVVIVYNNGKEAFRRAYSARTFTSEHALNTIKFEGDNFGFVDFAKGINLPKQGT
jgi:hypothetical protein